MTAAASFNIASFCSGSQEVKSVQSPPPQSPPQSSGSAAAASAIPLDAAAVSDPAQASVVASASTTYRTQQKHPPPSICNAKNPCSNPMTIDNADVASNDNPDAASSVRTSLAATTASNKMNNSDPIATSTTPATVTAVTRSDITGASSTITPTKKDVILGRGTRSNRHPGNIHFLQLRNAYQPQYLASTRREKASIAVELIQSIKNEGGRFLKQRSTDNWYVVDDNIAKVKATHSLRNVETPASRAQRRAIYESKDTVTVATMNSGFTNTPSNIKQQNEVLLPPPQQQRDASGKGIAEMKYRGSTSGKNCSKNIEPNNTQHIQQLQQDCASTMNNNTSESTDLSTAKEYIVCTESISDTRLTDVLSGRGGILSNPGNVAFLKYRDMLQGRYLAAQKSEKRTIAQELVSMIHNSSTATPSSPPGRFLRKIDGSGINNNPEILNCTAGASGVEESSSTNICIKNNETSTTNGNTDRIKQHYYMELSNIEALHKACQALRDVKANCRKHHHRAPTKRDEYEAATTLLVQGTNISATNTNNSTAACSTNSIGTNASFKTATYLPTTNVL